MEKNLQLRKWAIEQAIKAKESEEDFFSLADEILAYIQNPYAPKETATTTLPVSGERVEVDDGVGNAVRGDLPNGFYLLSPAERKIIAAARSIVIDNIFSTGELIKLTGHTSTKSVASQLSSLVKYGFIENCGVSRWRMIPEEERALGLALSKSEKEFMTEIWSYRGQYGSVTTNQIIERTGVSNVTTVKYLKTLTFAGYITRAGKKHGEWFFLRDPQGNPIEERFSKVELKKAINFEPFKRDGVTIYPPGYTGKKDDDLSYKNEVYDDEE